MPGQRTRAVACLLYLLASACAAKTDSIGAAEPTPAASASPTATPATTDPNGGSAVSLPVTALNVPAITALGLANSPNYVAQVQAALRVLNLAPVNSDTAVSTSRSRRFIFFNRTPHQLWIGAAGDTHGNALIGGGGWLLDANSQVAYTVPMPFTSARFWARPLCNDDPNNPTCANPTCTGANQTQCTLSGASGLTTLFEINMGSQGNDLDFYDISNVDAYNLPIAVVPVPGSYSGANPNDPFSCGSIVFAEDLNLVCPAPLQVTNTRSADVVDCKTSVA